MNWNIKIYETFIKPKLWGTVNRQVNSDVFSKVYGSILVQVFARIHNLKDMNVEKNSR